MTDSPVAPLDHRQALLGELQVGDHLRIEQADGIGRDRVAEAGTKLLRHGGAADHLAPFDHGHAQAFPGQIGRAGQAIMSGPDDDDVRLVHVRFIDR